MKIKTRMPSSPRHSSEATLKPHLGRWTSSSPACRPSASGFTLIETIVATLLAAIMLPTLFAGLASGFSIVQVTRENLRATQVIMQRMESIRLASYKTIKDAAAFPARSTECYSPSGQTNGTAGTVYTITYNCAPGPSSLPPTYRTNMLLVTVTATWNSGKVQHTRSMQSYVARYGIQRYTCLN